MHIVKLSICIGIFFLSKLYTVLSIGLAHIFLNFVSVCFIFWCNCDSVFLILIVNCSLIVYRITLDFCILILNPEILINFNSMFLILKHLCRFYVILLYSLNMHRLELSQSLKSYDFSTVLFWNSFSQFLISRFSLNTYLCSLISLRMPGSVWLLSPCSTVWKLPTGRESTWCKGSPCFFSFRDHIPALPVVQCLKIL